MLFHWFCEWGAFEMWKWLNFGVNKRKLNRNYSKLCYYTIFYVLIKWQRDIMFETTSSMYNCSAQRQHHSPSVFLSGITKIWIKILFISLIFALVQTSTPPTSSIQLQKRGDFLWLFPFKARAHSRHQPKKKEEQNIFYL
jgi:hypothetical protein